MASIYIDADGCPVVYHTLEVAYAYHMEVIVVCDSAHIFQIKDIETITVDSGRDSVDYAILNLLKKHDIVITQDYGLAALALGKQAHPISQNGLCYTDENIGSLLNQRHDYAMLRKSKKMHPHNRKRTNEDDERFMDALANLIEEVKQYEIV